MLLKGKVSADIKGRSLGQDFKLELAAEDMIGKARLGGKTVNGIEAPDKAEGRRCLSAQCGDGHIPCRK